MSEPGVDYHTDLPSPDLDRLVSRGYDTSQHATQSFSGQDMESAAFHHVGTSKLQEKLGGGNRSYHQEDIHCFCNRASYGLMIECDNQDCERGWFHLACIDITELPATNGKLIRKTPKFSPTDSSFYW